ncbi:hypothetical protein [Salidesulfovibrio onnuriiensis]|uniref:hypothetical protein n=1 Tax=Salidesulfovibrio onnuriiensis TaxID=2583823 RepID=UPI0011C8BB11|nr:hypothetical protein [Salidesulfovibrio onnuriiensis]
MGKTVFALFAGMGLLLLLVPGAGAFECDEANRGGMLYDVNASVLKIARGESWSKHVFTRTGDLYGVFRDKAEFERHLTKIVNDRGTPTKIFQQKTAYWDEASGVVIILDPDRADCGMALRPWEGRDYYDKLE